MYGTNIYWSLVSLGRDFPFPDDLLTRPSVPRNSVSERQKVMEHLNTVTSLLFHQWNIFDILVSENRNRHIKLCNERKNQPTLHPGYLDIVRNQLKSSAKKGDSTKYGVKIQMPLQVIRKFHPNILLDSKAPILKRFEYA